MIPIRDHNPSRHPAYVTWALIAANVGIHLWVMLAFTNDRALWGLYADYAMIPARLSAGQGWETLVTSTFLHGDLLHLGGNMLFLWIFGDNLEDELGHVGFAVFYLVCGAGAAAAQWLAAPESPIPTIGASGAIAGVMGGYLLLFPKAKIDIFLFLIILIRIVPLPAWVVLAIWFGLQVVNGAGSDALQGGVAYWAHAGGFVLGVLAILPAFLRRGGPAFWSRTHGHPAHAETQWGALQASGVPLVRRRKGPWP